MTLRNNDTQRLQIWKKSVQRFAITANLIGNGTLANVIFELINVKCILTRGGKEVTLCHENLQVLAQESAFFAGYEHALSKSAITLSATNKLIPLGIDLGSPVNLQGDDQLTLEVSTKVGWYGDFDASQSSLEVEFREAIGVEMAIPLIKTKAIQATLSRTVESLGDNITSITLLNLEDSRDMADANKVYDQVILQSDKYNVSDNRARLLARRATQFESVAIAAARKESFRYVPNVELDGVQITLELKGDNVVSSKNYIVYRSFMPTKDGIYRAQDMQEKHSARNQAKLAAQI